MAPNAYNLSILLLMRKAYEKNVSIQDRIKQFHIDHPDKTPLILVDLMHIDKLQHGQPKQNRYRNACGPNLSQLASIESVLRFLHRQQCRLVFFVAGPDNRDLQQDEHLDEFRTCPKDMRYERDIELIDALSAPNVNYREAVDRFGHIPTDRILFDSIVKVAKRYGSIVHALTNVRSLEMARYVVDHPDTLAVLGKFSTILLTAGIPQLKLWYVPNLNLKSMTVTELNARSVWDQMNLESKEKRLLMVGLLPRGFVGRHKTSNKVNATHELVAALPPELGEDQYRSIVEELFEPDRSDVTWEGLQHFCEMCDVNQITPSEQTDERQTSFAYDITHNRTSIITVMLNDYRYWTERSVDFYQLFVRFYRRLAGVVLKRSGAPTKEAVQRRIFIKRSHEDGFEHELVDVEFPDFDVASEADLQIVSVTETNLACLKFILDFEDMTAIREFTKEDKNRWKLLDYVTVQFMIKEQMISETLAATIMKAVETSSSETPALVTRLDLDAFHATFMYVRWRYYVREALVNAGFPQSCVDDMCRLDGSRLQMLVQRRRRRRGGLDAQKNAPAAVV